jgi:hypothetical protein
MTQPTILPSIAVDALSKVSGGGTKKAVGNAICNAAACAITGNHDADTMQRLAEQQSRMNSAGRAIVRPVTGGGGGYGNYGGFRGVAAPSIGGGRGGGIGGGGGGGGGGGSSYRRMLPTP